MVHFMKWIYAVPFPILMSTLGAMIGSKDTFALPILMSTFGAVMDSKDTSTFSKVISTFGGVIGGNVTFKSSAFGVSDEDVVLFSAATKGIVMRQKDTTNTSRSKFFTS